MQVARRYWGRSNGAGFAASLFAVMVSFGCGDDGADDSSGAGSGGGSGMGAQVGGSAGSAGVVGQERGGEANAGAPSSAGSGGQGGGSAGGVAGAPGGSGGASTAGTGAAGASSGGAGGDPGSAPAVRFVGRFDTSDAKGPRFAWSGSGMIARFRGTSVGIKLAGGQQYTAVVDGVVTPMKLVPGSGTTPIATGLTDGEHVVEVYRRTEANQGAAQFLGFDFGTGELLAPPPAPERRIEMIGDSITCGYGNEGANESCSFSPDTENHYLAYGPITARALEAELVTVAWSGKGIVCNYGDDASSCMNPLPEYYDLALPEVPSSTWNFASWQPHVVVINLGTNDMSTSMDPSKEQFEAAYEDFLEHIRSKYDDALILCTVGPLLSGSDLSTTRTYIANAVAARAAAGDTQVKTFELAPTDAADGWGCDYHPSLETHRKMAATLTETLKSELGW